MAKKSWVSTKAEREIHSSLKTPHEFVEIKFSSTTDRAYYERRLCRFCGVTEFKTSKGEWLASAVPAKQLIAQFKQDPDATVVESIDPSSR